MYEVKVKTKNNKTVIENLKSLRELTNYIWLAQHCEAKNIQIKVKRR